MAQSKTTAAKTQEIRLSSDELLAMVKADHQVALAKAEHENAQLAQVSLEAQIKLAAAEVTRKAETTKAALDAAQKHGEALGATLAERYDFDWKTHSYCTETGAVRRITED
jgi:hypothetical protein